MCAIQAPASGGNTMQQMEIEQAEAHNFGLWAKVSGAAGMSDEEAVESVRTAVETDPEGAASALRRRGAY